MQLTIDLPDMLSNESISQLIQKIEHLFLTEGIAFEINKELPVEDDA